MVPAQGSLGWKINQGHPKCLDLKWDKPRMLIVVKVEQSICDPKITGTNPAIIGPGGKLQKGSIQRCPLPAALSA
jgi:hypothetical protein